LSYALLKSTCFQQFWCGSGGRYTGVVVEPGNRLLAIQIRYPKRNLAAYIRMTKVLLHVIRIRRPKRNLAACIRMVRANQSVAAELQPMRRIPMQGILEIKTRYPNSFR
jgi:hypothetical protein